MKFRTLILVFLLSTVAGVFAQQFENESELYPVTKQIHRVYSHPKGYRVDFIRQDYTLGTFWAPLEWFRKVAGEGTIAYGNTAGYPYVTFFYKDGEVDHFRLYLMENPAHPSWDVLDVDSGDQFPSADSKPEVTF